MTSVTVVTRETTVTYVTIVINCYKCHDLLHMLQLLHMPRLIHHGDIDFLVKEGKCIQDHLQSTIDSGLKSTGVARKFDQLMKLGKVTAALNFFQQMPRVFRHLIQKYPVARMVMLMLFGNQ